MKREDRIGSLIRQNNINRIPGSGIAGMPTELADENLLAKVIAEMAGGSRVCT